MSKEGMAEAMYEKNYDRKMVVLELKHDLNAAASNATAFNINLDKGGFGPLKDVVALKLYSFEVVASDGGTFEAVSDCSVYVSLNDYNDVVTGNPNLPAIFARVSVKSSGVSFINAAPPVTLGADPLTHVFDPVQGNLSKFTVKLF